MEAGHGWAWLDRDRNCRNRRLAERWAWVLGRVLSRACYDSGLGGALGLFF